MTLQTNATDGSPGEQIALGGTSLDDNIREVFLDKDALSLLREVWIQCYLDDFSLAVGVGREIDDPASGRSLRDIVHLVACHRRHVESLDEVFALLAVAIHTVVDGALIVLLEHLHMEDVLSHEDLVGHLGHLELSVLIEDDDIVEVGTVAHQLILLQSCTHESFLSVDVEFLIGLHHLGHLDGVEVSYLGASWMRLAILGLEIFKPVDGDISHVGEVVLYLSQFGFDFQQEVVGLVLIIFQDALHFDFKEFQNVLARYLSVECILHLAFSVDYGCEELVLERLQLRGDKGHNLVLTLALLELALLVDALLDEDTLERGEEELLPSSPLRSINSLRSSPMVRSTLWRSTSLTVRKQGLLSSMTQQLGEMLISQSLKA